VPYDTITTTETRFVLWTLAINSLYITKHSTDFICVSRARFINLSYIQYYRNSLLKLA